MSAVLDREYVKPRIVADPPEKNGFPRPFRRTVDECCLKERCLEVHRFPVKDENVGYVYSEVSLVREGKSIAPLAKPKAKIKVTDILP